MATKKQARAASESTLFLVVLGGILLLLNVLGVFFNLRVDTTGKQLFSLAEGSRRVASSLEDRMEIRAYFSADLPPPHNATERYVRDMLSEYRDASKGKITVRFIRPVEDDQKAEAEREGVVRVQDQQLEQDSFAVIEGYRGIAISYLGENKSLPRIDSTAGLEYEITQAIKELTGKKTAVAVLSGHDGPSLTKGLASLQQYLPTYEMTEVAATAPIDAKYKALLIVHPEKPLSEQELRYINQYVMKGGALGVFGGGIKIDAGEGAPTASKVDTGLNALLEKWGVSVGDRIVADAQCGRARLPTQLGIPIPVPYPPVPIVSFDPSVEHPTTFKLDQIGVPYPVQVELKDALKADKQVTRTVVASSTKASWLMTGDPPDITAKPRWEVPGYAGPFPLGVALEGKLPSAFLDSGAASTPDAVAPATPVEAPVRAEANVHVLVLGSGYFLRDEFLPPPQDGQVNLGGGVAFALNSIDWLTQDSDLIAIRAKNVEEPALEIPNNVLEAEAEIREAIEEQDESKAKGAFDERKAAMVAWNQKKQSYRWGNTMAVPALFAVFGMVRWRIRKKRRAALKL
jgi:ABC-2 type transport system permease protein